MRKICLLLALSLLLSTVNQEEPIIYDLVRTDGYILARTEVQPSVGDTYWDATTDTWYTVISVQGTTALAATQAEARVFFRQRNLRIAAGVGVLLLAAYLIRRRLRQRH